MDCGKNATYTKKVPYFILLFTEILQVAKAAGNDGITSKDYSSQLPTYRISTVTVSLVSSLQVILAKAPSN